MKKSLKIIIPVVLIIAIAICSVVTYLGSKVKFNTNYVNGNTSGNLYNAGLFCESNGEIFFSNPDDNGRLYSMDMSGNNLKKLSDDTAMYINADSNYVYYVRNNDSHNLTEFSFFTYARNSLCRIQRNGKNAVVLDDDPCIYASLVGNYIYYLHYDDKTATTLYKIKIDGTERKKLTDKYQFTCNTQGQYFYYNSTYDGKLYRFDTATDTPSLFYDCNCYKPIVIDDSNAYYMDVDNDNAIVHVNISSPNPTTLTEGNIEHYNVYGSYIFYQRGGDTPALCMIKNDGSDYKEIASGEYCNICVTSKYIYFTEFYTDVTFYTLTSNPGDLNAFAPGSLSND